MWMNALRTTADAVSLPVASTYLTASIAPVILDDDDDGDGFTCTGNGIDLHSFC